MHFSPSLPAIYLYTGLWSGHSRKYKRTLHSESTCCTIELGPLAFLFPRNAEFISLFFVCVCFFFLHLKKPTACSEYIMWLSSIATDFVLSCTTYNYTSLILKSSLDTRTCAKPELSAAVVLEVFREYHALCNIITSSCS